MKYHVLHVIYIGETKCSFSTRLHEHQVLHVIYVYGQNQMLFFNNIA